MIFVNYLWTPEAQPLISEHAWLYFLTYLARCRRGLRSATRLGLAALPARQTLVASLHPHTHAPTQPHSHQCPSNKGHAQA